MIIDDSTINAVIDILRSRGAVITFPVEAATLITVKEFREKYTQLPPASLCMLFQRTDCPAFYSEFGRSGRILKMRPSLELIRFVNSYTGSVRGAAEVDGQHRDGGRLEARTTVGAGQVAVSGAKSTPEELR